MKNILRLAMILVLAMAVGACGPDDENNGNNGGNNGADAGDVMMDGDQDVDDDADTPSGQNIVAGDQTVDPANEVTVDEVVSDGAGWVVIHEQNDAGDAAGAVIGNAAVADGTSTDVVVTIDRDAEDGETLYAMLHDDDPADGNYTFDPTAAEPEDPPATNDAGETVVDPFVVSLPGVVTPSVTVSDQTPDPANEVVVDEVVSDGAGWMVIHEQNDAGDDWGAVIGNAAVSDGTNTDVTVALDRDIVDGETLYAMLHTDDPADGNYTFDATAADPEDPPVRSGGEVVVEPFVVSTPSNEPSITATNQTLDLSTLVTVDSANVLTDGFIVIHEEDDAGTSFGAVIGHTPVSAGTVTDATVGLERPVADGETLYAMLHEDTGTIGTYEFDGTSGSPDPPVRDSGDNVVVVPFDANVPADTPAVRFTLDNNSLASWDVASAEPARYEAWIGSGVNNQTITMNASWRYEIVNNGTASAHPFELIKKGATPTQDTVLASQDTNEDGTLEADTDVNWTQSGDNVQFTVTTSMAAELDGYRCGDHTLNMRGDVTTQAP